MTGGMAFEGLNNFGHSGRKAIIILNDNGRSYAPPSPAWARAWPRLRLNPTWLRNQERLGAHHPQAARPASAWPAA